MQVRFPRVVERLLGDELLSEFPAVLLVGPRGSGKSTSAAVFASDTIDLSVPSICQSVREDPDGVLASAVEPVVVDEWQEAPEIIGAVKRAIDADLSRRPGRFVITGSVRASGGSVAMWPGTGRLVRVRMFGLTQGEIEFDNAYNPVEVLFGPCLPQYAASSLSRSDYVERIVAGRWPAVLGRTGRGRGRWFNAYISHLAEVDAPTVSDVRPRPQKVRAVLNSCAARTGLEQNKQATARDADTSHATADAHLQLLEDLSAIVRIPAWHSRRLQRLTRSPKIHVADPGLAAHLLNIDAVGLIRDATLIGQLMETFVVSELLPHIESATERTEMFHYRDRDGHEVDLLLERGGRIVALEVKSSTTANRRDARNLLWLRDRLDEDFHLGAVLYTGKFPFRIDDRIWALPIGTLWRPAR